MHGHPKELAGHGAKLPRVSTRARVYCIWSMWLIDFLHWLEGPAHQSCHLTPGGHMGRPLCHGDLVQGQGSWGSYIVWRKGLSVLSMW